MATIKKERFEGFVDFEKKFVVSISLVATLFSLIGFIINILLDFDLAMKIIPVVSFVIYTVLYFWGKQSKDASVVKWVFAFITLIFMNLLWLNNYGSHGPAPYFFILLFSLLIFIWHGRYLLIAGGTLILNVAIIFYFDFNNPTFTPDYASESDRIIDVYTGILLYALIIFVMMSSAKNSYINEYKKAKRSDALKSAFLANMSHEIRTPLNAIVGFSNLLSSDLIPEEEKQTYIDIINENNDSLLRLFEDIIDISSIDTGQLEIFPEDCDINNLLDNLETMFTQVLEKAEKPEIQLISNKLSENRIITTDKKRLLQILTNLLDNAVKFTNEGSITFGCVDTEEALLFSVTDTGIGIKKSNAQYIFDRFYKAEDDQSTLYRGTGIGLFMAKSLTELMGGEIWMESEPGKGSSFFFTVTEP